MSSLGIFNKETKTYQKVAGTAEAAVLDAEMSDTSENPVQNKVIKKYVDEKQVKHGDGLVVTEDGTLKVSLDGTTLTMDQVNNVIKLADTLKDAINGAFPAANVVNNLTTTEAGFALDARQANPNIGGTLAKQISDLNTDWFKYQNNVADLNDATKSGIYIVLPELLNSPVPLYGICITFAIYSGSNMYIMQIVKNVDIQDYNLYIRVSNEISGWGKWKTVALSDVGK